MRRMLDPKEAGGSLPSTIKFDTEGNRTVGKNLGVDGKLTLKSLVSESNPDGDITKELGGGGSNKITITATKSDWTDSGPTPHARWSSNAGRALKPNTAYEIGDTVSASFIKEFNDQSLDSNQILVPGTATLSISDNNYTLKYGDVVLSLTEAHARLNIGLSRYGTGYSITANCYLTYTVIKAGTTGADVSLRSSGWNSVYSYSIYTIEASAQ